MDRQTWFLLAVSLFVIASLAVSAAGWVLFTRERRISKAERDLRASEELRARRTEASPGRVPPADGAAADA